jgi:hypothetical protein
VTDPFKNIIHDEVVRTVPLDASPPRLRWPEPLTAEETQALVEAWKKAWPDFVMDFERYKRDVKWTPWPENK